MMSILKLTLMAFISLATELIDDVRYDGEWDFSNTGTMKEALVPEE